MLAAGFDYLLHLVGLFRIRADVLLHLVEGNQRQRKLAVPGQGVMDGIDHLLVGDVLHVGVLLAQQLTYLFDVITEGAVDGQQRPGNAAGDIEVFQLVFPVIVGRFYVGFHLLENALLVQPENKARLMVLFRQTGGLEHDIQQRQAHVVIGARAQGAGGRMQTTMTLSLDAQLLEVILDFLRQVGNVPSRYAIIERLVGPERAEHFCQMRFTRTEETGDPHAGLFVPVAQVA